MWVLLVLSLLGFIFFLERSLYMHRGQIKAIEFAEGLINLLGKRRHLEALTLCEETPGPVAKVAKAALLHNKDSAANMRLAVQEAALVELPPLERRIGTIGAIAKIAPLLGLLGTVLALLQGFFSMGGEQSYANASQFAALFGEALLTTAAGLTIMIMALLAHHFLIGRVKAIVHDMEWTANKLMDFILKDAPQKQNDKEEKAD